MKQPFNEWIDPVTEERHTCPEHFVSKLMAVIGHGVAQAKTSDELLVAMREEVNEKNKRHLRRAAAYWKNHATPVISLRSSKGGYFIATTAEEINTYIDEQVKLGERMIRNAQALRKAFLETVGQQAKLFV